MKIAIQGHLTRGKEVIQILESLGGINIKKYSGCYSYNKNNIYYYIDNNNEINYDHKDNFPLTYKLYTLEEFEEEFPFKVGDKVKHISSIGIIRKYCYINNKPCYEVESMELGIIATILVKLLEPYKEMEIRDITLTLEKAKEWYKNGGELKEVALQAYSEEELTRVELPKTWEEFCDKFSIKIGECWIGALDNIYYATKTQKRRYKNWMPSKKSAEAHLALIQLEQLRDCYRQGDIPDFNNDNKKYCIIKTKNDINIMISYNNSCFLSFTKKEIAEEFLTNFEPLIKIAEDYI